MTDPRVPLRALLESLAGRVDVGAVERLFAVGEWHVGFEALGARVYDASVALTAEELRLVDAAADGWDDPAYRRAAQFAAASLRAAGPRGADGRWSVRLLTVAHVHGEPLREALRLALGPGDWQADAWHDLPVTAQQLPHVLDLRDWDVLRAAHPGDARALVEWLLAASAGGEFKVVITDSDDEPVDPHSELRRL